MKDQCKSLIALLRQARLDLSNEKRTQNDVAKVLTEAGISHQREHRLSGNDIVDFFIEGIGLEIKLQGARKKEIFRQLRRYAKHEKVISLCLASNVSMGLPPEIEGKPVYFVNLAEAWL